jgi:hypothetical protein
VDPGDPLDVAGRPLYIVTDDGRDLNIVGGHSELGRVDFVRGRHPDVETVARFSRPGSNLGVTVLRSR